MPTINKIVSDNIEELLRLAREHSEKGGKRLLIAFDIDSTTTALKQTFGGDPWFGEEMKEQRQKYSPRTALGNVMPMYLAAQHRSDVRLVDPRTPQVIKTLQELGHIVVVVTSRSYPLAETTKRQQNSVGISFQYGIFADNITGLNVGHEPDGRGSAAESMLRYGMLFTNGRNKGKCVKELHDYLQTEYHTKVRKVSADDVVVDGMLFIDDGQHHVDAVEKIANEMGINCTAICYTKHHPHLAVDPDIARIQRDHFRILSDEEASAHAAKEAVAKTAAKQACVVEHVYVETIESEGRTICFRRP